MEREPDSDPKQFDSGRTDKDQRGDLLSLKWSGGRAVDDTAEYPLGSERGGQVELDLFHIDDLRSHHPSAAVYQGSDIDVSLPVHTLDELKDLAESPGHPTAPVRLGRFLSYGAIWDVYEAIIPSIPFPCVIKISCPAVFASPSASATDIRASIGREIWVFGDALIRHQNAAVPLVLGVFGGRSGSATRRGHWNEGNDVWVMIMTHAGDAIRLDRLHAFHRYVVFFLLHALSFSYSSASHLGVE